MRGAVLILTLLANAAAFAQVSAPRGFEVVSIKLNTSGGIAGGIRPQPGGRLVMVNAPIARLIRIAYPTQSPQLVGAPSWVESERYDVDARAAGQPTEQEMEAMLRALLTERMKLVARVERRQQDVYALVRADSSGRGNRRLSRATLDCAEFVERRPASGLTLAPRANGAPPCGLSSDGRRLLSGGLTIAQLIRNISPFVDRVVVDRTGLDGYYEFTLEFAARPANAAGLPDLNDDRPSIFSALQEQLGLRLQPQRAAVEMLVIDRIERPEPN
jgi:uncharacterized protein (TIGR03435 family)